MAKSWIILAIFLQINIMFSAPISSQCSCGHAGQSQNSSVVYDPISGLNVSNPGRWCWQVALQNEAGSVFCSAVMIDPLFAITPGQCIYGRQANTTFIRIGAFDLSAPGNASQILAVDEIIIHQGYLNIDTRNDYNIAVIRLASPVDCAKGAVCIACLPERSSLNRTNECLSTTWNNRAASVNSGKGIMNVSRPLRERPAQIMDQIDCETILRADVAIKNDYRLSDNKFCLREAENVSKCLGDLGDPLVCKNADRYEVTGLNTIGFSCFRPSLPSFFVRVSALVDWIIKVMEQSQGPTRGSAIISAVGLPAVQQTLTPPVAVPVQNPNPPTSTAAPVAPAAVVPGIVISSGPASVSVVASQNVPVHVNTQQMGADGALIQVGLDGSVQRQEALTAPSLLQQVSPGVFRANIGNGFIDLGPTAGGFAFPPIAIQAPQTPLTVRTKREYLQGVIGANATANGYNVPTIHVSANDANYDQDSGRFVFNLPQGGTAISSVSFLPTNVDEIKQQIIAQQDKILAQVDDFKKNILVSISAQLNNAGIKQTPIGTGSAVKYGLNTEAAGASAGASNVARPISNAVNQVTNQINSNQINNNQATYQATNQDFDVALPVTTTRRPYTGRSNSGAQSASFANKNSPRLGVNIASNANAGGPSNDDPTSDSDNGGVQTSRTNDGGFRTSVQADRPSSGSLATALKTGNSFGAASIGFKGDHVSGETRHAPGSSSSSVSASSTG